MGVPKFYRWASERYPLINQKIGKDTEFLPKFDNMYLDMNGIIHNCTHPNDEDVTSKISFKDMVLGMFSYVDRMVHIVKPQKVLMLAVDGCAPRAKMNQQRSRRFASARDRREALEAATAKGEMTDDDARDQFDSNCITPGTEFMEQVSQHFQYFVRLKIKEDPLWRKLKVVYSGHDVPGEGEHKIMDYIRHTRMQPGYDPDTRHCLCGLDADLIMLGLASHEPHFSLLREEVDFSGGRGGKKGGSNTTKEVKKQVEQDKWELLHVSALRQYLDLEFRSSDLPFGYDLERIIDDWVLLIMLVGNDFLPNLPSISIAEGGLNHLMDHYRATLPTLDGYLTQDGKVHFDRLEKILVVLGEEETEVFTKREIQNRKMAKRNKRSAHAQQASAKRDDSSKSSSENASSAPFADFAREQGIVTNKSSFKEKYYGEKFGVSLDDVDVIDKVVLSYIEGIQWCYLYYYQGVQSWTWFFPFHYAPLASDLKNLSRFDIKLKKGQPFRPFMQLLSCLPSDSAGFLPECYRELMTHTTSPLAEFYPRDFKVDMNGKRNPWEGVNLLPFIDERRLVEAVQTHCPEEKLTQAEKDRNSFGHELVFALDLSNMGVVKSTFPAAGLQDIEMCQTSASRFFLPPMEKFVPDLLPGCVADGAWPGDPQLLAALPLDQENPGGLEPLGILVFNRSSDNDSVVINVKQELSPELLGPSAFQAAQAVRSEDPDDFAKPVSEAFRVLQKNRKDRLTVFVDYPNLREAQVMAIADDSNIYTLCDQGNGVFDFVQQVQTETDIETFFHNAEIAENRALLGARAVGTGGVRIGEVYVMVKVRPIKGMEVDSSTGAVHQVFSENETWVPLQLVCVHNKAVDPRFVTKGPQKVEERFPCGSKVMCLQDAGYGLVGTVVGHENNAVKAEFNMTSPRIPPFGHTIAKSIVDQYVSSFKAAQHFKLDPSVLGKVTGSVLVRPGHFDIGLNLKVGRGWVIAGYARAKSSESNRPPWSAGEAVTVISGLNPVERTAGKGNDSLSNASGGWEYTSRALELVAVYRKKFPEVFHALQEKPNTVEYGVEEIFGPGSNGKKRLQEVCTWLEQIDTFRLPLVPVTSQHMSRDAIVAAQRASDDVRKNVLKMSPSPNVVLPISPDVLFKHTSDIESTWIKSPTRHFPPRLGDRVTNLGSPVVPFGLGGTVVATHASTGCVEVLFDSEFIGGTSLYGACGNNRGKLLPWSQLLNISKRAPLKAGGTSRKKQSHGKAHKIQKFPKAEMSQGRQKQNSTEAVRPEVTRALESRARRKEAAQTRGKNTDVKPPSRPAASRFVVPAVPQPQPVASTQMLAVVSEPTNEQLKALAALAPGPEQASAIETGQTSSSSNTGNTDELADFWNQLRSQKKGKKDSRKTRKSKSANVAVTEDNTKAKSKADAPRVPKIQVAPQSTSAHTSSQQGLVQNGGAPVLVPPPGAPRGYPVNQYVAAVQTPDPPMTQEVAKSQVDDELDQLFERAAKATGKGYHRI